MADSLLSLFTELSNEVAARTTGNPEFVEVRFSSAMFDQIAAEVLRSTGDPSPPPLYQFTLHLAGATIIVLKDNRR